MKSFTLFTLVTAGPVIQIELQLGDVEAPDYAYFYNEHGEKEVIDAYEYETIEAMLADYNSQSTPSSYEIGRWDTTTTVAEETTSSTTTTTSTSIGSTEKTTTTSTSTTSTTTTTESTTTRTQTTSTTVKGVEVAFEQSGESEIELEHSGELVLEVDPLVILSDIKMEKLTFHTVELPGSGEIQPVLLLAALIFILI